MVSIDSDKTIPRIFGFANLNITEHCTGECSDEEIDAARDQCTTEYESSNPSTECDCHCHGAEGMQFSKPIPLFMLN
jgi:hypothetical protein